MDKVSNIPPQHPRGGQVFLIRDDVIRRKRTTGRAMDTIG
jgi:hypothetical protein